MHIDHSGRIPLLVKQGYQGPIYAQNATVDLCDILLQDSAFLQEKDAQYENKWRKRKKKPLIEPLYTVADARDALNNLIGLRYREKQEILPGVSIRYQDAGHILGSASAEIWLHEKGKQRKVVFSGDLGQYYDQWELDRWQVFLDSPMAIRASKVYWEYPISMTRRQPGYASGSTKCPI
ncbi:MAG: hypothetical protein KZQ99_00175 [Candidatus Thiodiazotropha sp. (ex Dulcina madagascariensis)]|nr:hypothetical protein [Candidatus Thiodiazotropha sp. (ex Dulcina madagascariensis)]